MSSDKAQGMSFVEVMLTIVVITLGVLPLLTSIGSTGRTVYSMGKHQLAALVARSTLDRLLLLPYDACRKECLEMGSEINVTDDEELSEMISAIDFEHRDYDRMTRRVIVKDASSAEEQDLMFVIEVVVSWPAQNTEEKRDFSFKTIKYENRI